jgi:hypothetical protein
MGGSAIGLALSKTFIYSWGDIKFDLAVTECYGGLDGTKGNSQPALTFRKKTLPTLSVYTKCRVAVLQLKWTQHDYAEGGNSHEPEHAASAHYIVIFSKIIAR